MKRIFLLVAALLITAATASATATTQKWTAGWDFFGEPLNYTKSKISWSVNATMHKLSVTFTLVGATPSKLYQVGIVPFCSTFPATFGQFPVDDGGTCQSLTRQGVTATAAIDCCASASALRAMVPSPLSSGRSPQVRITSNSRRATVRAVI